MNNHPTDGKILHLNQDDRISENNILISEWRQELTYWWKRFNFFSKRIGKIDLTLCV